MTRSRSRRAAVAAAVLISGVVVGELASRGPLPVHAERPPGQPLVEHVANGSQVPLEQMITQYAPAGLAGIVQDVAPITVDVGGTPLTFEPTANGVLTATSATLTATITYNRMADVDALAWSISLTNTGVTPIGNVKVDPFRISTNASPSSSRPCVLTRAGVDGNFRPTSSIFSSWSTPTHVIEGVTAGPTAPIMQVAFTGGSSCNELTPTAMNGFFVGMGWSWGWKLQAGWNAGASPFVVTGNSKTGTFQVGPGETVEYPPVHFGFFSGTTWQDASDAQRRYISERLTPSLSSGDSVSAVSYDSFFGAYSHDNLDFLKEQARQAAVLGVQYFTIDAGWYGDYWDENWDYKLGNYYTPSQTKYPQRDSMKELCQYVRSLGMQCGLWFVIQSAQDNTDAVNRRPALYAPMSAPRGGRHKLQLQTPAGVAWANEMVTHMIDELDLKWVRFETQDQSHLPAGAPYDSLQYNWGIYEVVDHLRATFPDVYVEASQTGGRRLDLGMAQRSHGNWLKDFSFDPIDSRQAQMRGLRLWPANYLNLTDTACIETNLYLCSPYSDQIGSQYQVLSRMLGKLSFDGAIAEWSDASVAALRPLIATYKQLVPLQREPLAFPLPEASSQLWDALVMGDQSSPNQAMYVFRGGAGSSATSTFTPPPTTGAWKLLSGPDSGAALTANANGSVTVALPQNSGALWIRDRAAIVSLAAPTAVRAIQANGTVTMNWTNNAPVAAGSIIERSVDGAAWSIIGQVDAGRSNYVDAALGATPGGTNRYRVRSYDATITGTSAPSLEAVVTVIGHQMPVVIDDTSSQISYSGAFSLPSAWPAYQGSVNDPLFAGYRTVHRASSGSFTSTCVCSRIDWLARTSPTSGIATAVITDAGGVVLASQSVDLFSAATSTSTVVFSKTVSTGGQGYCTCTLTVTPTGTKNPSSAGTFVEIDALQTIRWQPSFVDDGSGAITYSSMPALTGMIDPLRFTSATVHSSSTTGASATFSCSDCSGLRWYTRRGAEYGKAEVTIDGRPMATVDLSQNPTSRIGYEITLPLGKHTISVKALGTKNPLATGNRVDVDGFQATQATPLNTNVNAVDDADSGFAYTGFTVYPATSPYTNPVDFYRSTAHSSNVTGHRVTFTCTCTRIRWQSGRGPLYGISSVVVDGAAARDVDVYSSTRVPSTTVFDTGVLTRGTHTITITVTGRKNAAATGTWTEIDGLLITD